MANFLPRPDPKKFGVLLYPQFEVLDTYGPLECLNSLTHAGYEGLECYTIARSKEPASTVSSPPMLASPGFKQATVIDLSLSEALEKDLEVLLIPGGYGSGPLLPPDFTKQGPDVAAEIDFVKTIYPRLKYLITVCTGSSFPARAGVLDGHRATTNKVAWTLQTPLGPKTHWIAKARWVESGNIWTCSGVSAGTDGTLAWIGKVWGEDVADQIADGMEWVRVIDPGEDPFAEKNGCVDVLPVE